MDRTLIGLAAVAALALGGCAPGYGGGDGAGYYASGLDLAPVLSWRDDGARVRVRVPSNGCTTGDDFETEVTGSARGGWAFDMALTRVCPDECGVVPPTSVELSWTKGELGLPDGAQVRVVNPRAGDVR